MKNHTSKIIYHFVLAGIFLLVAGADIFGQARKPSIAVIPFSQSAKASSGAGEDIGDKIIDGLVNSGKFTVVDRSKTSVVKAEQLDGIGGGIDPATAAAIGKRIGAQFMILGNVSEMGERTKPLGLLGMSTTEAIVKFNIRAVDTSTGEITASQTFEKKGSGMGSKLQESLNKTTNDAIAMIVSRLGSIPGIEMSPAAMTNVSAQAAAPAYCSRLTGARAPRIMVVIPEIHITRTIPDPAGETEIVKKLVNLGFNLVDQGQIAVIRDRERVLMATKNPAAAAALGAEFGANVIIIGQAFSELAGGDSGFVVTRARVEARAIQTDTARILAAEGTFGTGRDIGEFVSAKAALRNAGTAWADYFVGQICKTPAIMAAGPIAVATPSGGVQGNPLVQAAPSAFTSSVEIAISGISFMQLKQFADRVEKIAGVKSVEKKLTGNVARVDVQFDGNAEKLADRISETSFGLMKVNIIGLTGSKIEITVGK